MSILSVSLLKSRPSNVSRALGPMQVSNVAVRSLLSLFTSFAKDTWIISSSWLNLHIEQLRQRNIDRNDFGSSYSGLRWQGRVFLVIHYDSIQLITEPILWQVRLLKAIANIPKQAHKWLPELYQHLVYSWHHVKSSVLNIVSYIYFQLSVILQKNTTCHIPFWKHVHNTHDVALIKFRTERFKHLLQLVGPYISKGNSRSRESISAQERLCLWLRYLATGDSQSTWLFYFWVGRATVFRIIDFIRHLDGSKGCLHDGTMSKPTLEKIAAFLRLYTI